MSTLPLYLGNTDQIRAQPGCPNCHATSVRPGSLAHISPRHPTKVARGQCTLGHSWLVLTTAPAFVPRGHGDSVPQNTLGPHHFGFSWLASASALPVLTGCLLHGNPQDPQLTPATGPGSQKKSPGTHSLHWGHPFTRLFLQV